MGRVLVTGGAGYIGSHIVRMLTDEGRDVFVIDDLSEGKRGSIGEVPLVVGDFWKTLKFWKTLFDEGIFVNPIIPPAVPPNTSLLRTSYMATHTDEILDRVIEVVGKIGKQLGVI